MHCKTRRPSTGLACSFVGNQEEVQHQHQPYPCHQKPLEQGVPSSSTAAWEELTYLAMLMFMCVHTYRKRLTVLKYLAVLLVMCVRTFRKRLTLLTYFAMSVSMYELTFIERLTSLKYLAMLVSVCVRTFRKRST